MNSAVVVPRPAEPARQTWRTLDLPNSVGAGIEDPDERARRCRARPRPAGGRYKPTARVHRGPRASGVLDPEQPERYERGPCDPGGVLRPRWDAGRQRAAAVGGLSPRAGRAW